MARARAAIDRERRNAALYRDGFQIALLAARPLRLKNFSSIVIGQHLVKPSGRWRMEFTAAEMKNHHPLEFDVPEQLVEHLEYYISGPRKLLCDELYQGKALWVSHWWQPQDRNTIHGRLCKRTQDEYGLPITPHLFRDCAATSLAV